MNDITICFTYFRSLTLANLEAALYSVRQQDLSCVDQIVIVDNDAPDPLENVLAVIEQMVFPVPVFLIPCKHDDPTKTHSWSSNVAVRHAETPWVFFTRADYLLDFSILHRLTQVVDAHDAQWDGFVTSNGCHLSVDITTCEQSPWRATGPQVLQRVGNVYDYTHIDSGVWLARREAFDRVGGLDERLTAWGHSQTHFQYKLHRTGTEFVRIPEVLFFHPAHGGAKDLGLAHAQIREIGVDLREMWSRYEGMAMY